MLSAMKKSPECVCYRGAQRQRYKELHAFAEFFIAFQFEYPQAEFITLEF
jgi:hypothetical protein